KFDDEEKMRRLIALLFIIVAESSAQDAPADDVLNERLAITAQQLLSDAGIEATNIYVNSPMFPIDQLVCSVIAKFPELFPGILRNFEHLENYDREGCIARRLWFDRVEDIDEDDFKVAIRS